MILLGDMLTKLATGELSNLSMSNDSTTISPSAYAKVIGHLNTALTQVHTIFLLSEKYILVNQIENITNYVLKAKYAISSGSSEPYKYIIDSPTEPFLEDVIKITSVYDSYNRFRPLNDLTRQLSVFTITPTTLQVPQPVPDEGLGIMYQARHPKLVSSGANVLTQEIEVPVFIEDLLALYVAHKIYSNLNGQENKAVGQNFLNDFKQGCNDIIANNMVETATGTPTPKFNARGFA